MEDAPCPNPRLSCTIYGFCVDRHFPWDMGESESARAIPLGSLMGFLRANHEELRSAREDEPGPFGFDEFSERKLRYYEAAADIFGFFRRDELIGVFVGTPIDWSSYYLRFCELLPRYRGAGRFQRFMSRYLSILESHGIERAEGDISPANIGNIHTFNKLGFNVNQLSVSERWGAMIHMTRFLSSRHEMKFLKSFCHGRRVQTESREAEAARRDNAGKPAFIHMEDI